jgi:hypothetical protein
MPRKIIDPKRIALMDRQAKLQAECARHYGRMKRAFNRLEKARRALARTARQLERLDATAGA